MRYGSRSPTLRTKLHHGLSAPDNSRRTARSHTARQIGDELIVDTQRHAAHPDDRHLVCLVIDHEGRLANPHGLENDLETEAMGDGLPVSVSIIDR